MAVSNTIKSYNRGATRADQQVLTASWHVCTSDFGVSSLVPGGDSNEKAFQCTHEAVDGANELVGCLENAEPSQGFSQALYIGDHKNHDCDEFCVARSY